MNGQKLEKVSEFKYLGRILTDDNNKTKATNYQIRRAQQQWNCIAKILKQKGANAMTIMKFYMAEAQAVLLYSLDSWVILDRNWSKLWAFHNKAL